MSKIYVDEIAGIASPSTVAIPGHVIQVVSSTKTDTQSQTGLTWTDVSDLSVNITPTSTTSKILVTINLCMGTSEYQSFARLLRDSTSIFVNASPSNRAQVTLAMGGGSSAAVSQYRVENASMTYLDSPATTNQVTYKVQMAARADGTIYAYINRTGRDLDSADGYDTRGVSSITVMEIAG